MTADKKRTLTEKQILFLEYLFDEECRGNVGKALRKAGYEGMSPNQIISSLHEEITDLANKKIAAESGQAVFAMLDALSSPNALGTANKIKAATEVLNRAGVQKKTEENTIKIPESGIVILPAKVHLEVDAPVSDRDTKVTIDVPQEAKDGA